MMMTIITQWKLDGAICYGEEDGGGGDKNKSEFDYSDKILNQVEMVIVSVIIANDHSQWWWLSLPVKTRW